MIYQETSGSNGNIYDVNPPKQHASWGLSWGFAWGNSWGFIRYVDPFGRGSNATDILYEEGSGEGPSPHTDTSGTSSEEIYEVN